MVGLETETVGVTGKSKETMGLEAETVAGTESGVDLKLTADQSGAVAGAKASVGSTIATAGADMRSMVVGTATGDGAAVVAWTEVHTNAGLGISRTET